MNFLSLRQRHSLLNNPLVVAQHWHVAMYNARNSVREGNLVRARSYYASAFDLADLMLEAGNYDDQSQCRLALSAVELAFTLKCSGKRITRLADLVEHRLHGLNQSALVRKLIAMLHRHETSDGTGHTAASRTALV